MVPTAVRKPILELDIDEADDEAANAMPLAAPLALEDDKVARAAAWCEEIVCEIQRAGGVTLDGDDGLRLARLVNGYYAEGKRGITLRCAAMALERQRAIAIKEFAAALAFIDTFGWLPDPAKPRYPGTGADGDRVAQLFARLYARMVRAHGFLYRSAGLANGYHPAEDDAA